MKNWKKIALIVGGVIVLMRGTAPPFTVATGLGLAEPELARVFGEAEAGAAEEAQLP